MLTTGIKLNAVPATASEWPLSGKPKRTAVRCYCNGVWQTIDPNEVRIIEDANGRVVRRTYEVIDIGGYSGMTHRARRRDDDDVVSPQPVQQKPLAEADVLRNSIVAYLQVAGSATVEQIADAVDAWKSLVIRRMREDKRRRFVEFEEGGATWFRLVAEPESVGGA